MNHLLLSHNRKDEGIAVLIPVGPEEQVDLVGIGVVVVSVGGLDVEGRLRGGLDREAGGARHLQ